MLGINDVFKQAQIKLFGNGPWVVNLVDLNPKQQDSLFNRYAKDMDDDDISDTKRIGNMVIIIKTTQMFKDLRMRVAMAKRSQTRKNNLIELIGLINTIGKSDDPSSITDEEAHTLNEFIYKNWN